MKASNVLGPLVHFLILSGGCPVAPDDDATPGLTETVVTDSGSSVPPSTTDSGHMETPPVTMDSGVTDTLPGPTDAGTLDAELSTSDTDSGISNVEFQEIDAGHGVWTFDGGVPYEADAYLPLNMTSCAALCLARTENANGAGGCDFSWNSGDCETRCMEMAPYSEQSQSAFAQCTLNDPLCYQDIEQCVWQGRYPWPDTLLIPTTFSGLGFDSYDGDTLTVVLHSSANVYEYAPEQIIANGTFEVHWDVSTNPSTSNLFMYYIDVDADGHCNTSIDYGGSLHGEMGPNWDAPTLSGEEVFENNNHAFVCDYID
jgi:hypothetical protein